MLIIVVMESKARLNMNKKLFVKFVPWNENTQLTLINKNIKLSPFAASTYKIFSLTVRMFLFKTL